MSVVNDFLSLPEFVSALPPQSSVLAAFSPGLSTPELPFLLSFRYVNSDLSMKITFEVRLSPPLSPSDHLDTLYDYILLLYSYL
jgi:hypothetical protein